MKKLIATHAVLITLLMATSCSTEQDPVMEVQKQETVADKHDASAKPYTYVEQIPVFKGGENAMLAFLGSNINYPKAAKKAGVEGITVLSFVINTDGSVSDIQTVKSLSPETDQEAARVVKLTSGNWTPGRQDGKPVPVRYTLPVRYTIK
ncbi:energy transducer TonB [Pontibacter sp. E15-1]|uniref:energy transducer TonB n=1 Tax=Pontibacter sp. E15-1 TaxID=2919918 RepID=UPI001F4F2156|nr:energy transducer TonB [Pontibacter sp. E15-1]MCJ8164464.1 energy transducer TonB [Pontibacter sp. E15-1]